MRQWRSPDGGDGGGDDDGGGGSGAEEGNSEVPTVLVRVMQLDREAVMVGMSVVTAGVQVVV